MVSQPGSNSKSLNPRHNECLKETSISSQVSSPSVPWPIPCPPPEKPPDQNPAFAAEGSISPCAVTRLLHRKDMFSGTGQRDSSIQSDMPDFFCYQRKATSLLVDKMGQSLLSGPKDKQHGSQEHGCTLLRSKPRLVSPIADL